MVRLMALENLDVSQNVYFSFVNNDMVEFIHLGYTMSYIAWIIFLSNMIWFHLNYIIRLKMPKTD